MGSTFESVRLVIGYVSLVTLQMPQKYIFCPFHFFCFLIFLLVLFCSSISFRFARPLLRLIGAAAMKSCCRQGRRQPIKYFFFKNLMQEIRFPSLPPPPQHNSDSTRESQRFWREQEFVTRLRVPFLLTL
jgi:hypothetical protein